MIPPQDVENSQMNYEVARTSVAVAESNAAVARANLKEAEANLGYTTIQSPVKGVILDRRVNIGQTVVASLNAPSLFLIAKDLGRMEIWASVNETDIGAIHLGQAAHFTVGAFPGETFAAVDPLSIQWSTNGAYVWKVVDGKAVRGKVDIVQRNSDGVLVKGDVKPGDAVVTQGVLQLADNMPVRLLDQAAAAGTPGQGNQGAQSAPGGGQPAAGAPAGQGQPGDGQGGYKKRQGQGASQASAPASNG